MGLSKNICITLLDENTLLSDENIIPVAEAQYGRILEHIKQRDRLCSSC